MLDPSYGGCAVLRVALDEMRQMNTPEPSERVYGADIDDAAAKWAAHLVSQGVPAKNLVSGDFLALAPGAELPLVGAVVGNPPYVRHHRITAPAKAAAEAAATAAGVRLSGRASLWAYFVVHAARFVEPGGRMALLLPSAVTEADYARAVMRQVVRCFDDVLLVRVRERIFPDALEETVALFASGARPQGDPVVTRHAAVKDAAELERLLALREADSFIPTRTQTASSDWKLELMTPATQDLMSSLLDNPAVSPLGEVAHVKLGTVTGANDVFVLSDRRAQELHAFESTVPVVSRSKWLSRPIFTSADHSERSAGSAARLLVLPPDPVDRRTRLGRYLSAAERSGIRRRSHCQNDAWWSLRGVTTPDAFLPYMMGDPRGLALNQAEATSTNTVHQVVWRDPAPSKEAAAWAISTWSSLGRLCAELYGRHLGGGVLKLELSEARRLPIVTGLRVANPRCLTDHALTVAAADEALCARMPSLKKHELSMLQHAAALLAARRRGSQVVGSVATSAAS